ncbi:MAG: thrombospondin type 3 repeat-containing protein [Patescibacteria group bacterium]|nr:thrombospondin type 3 repeat-containing protein [Patescibacteria group bacterium]
MKLHRWFFALAIALAPLSAYAADYDIQIPSGGITVDHTPIMLGQTAKIYVTVNNLGNKDTEGTSIFMDNGTNIGMKAISAKASGRPEEIWQIWKPTAVGSHIIKVKLVPDESIFDPSPENNEAQITVFVDKDTDGDGIGDSVDPDIDGDGVPNAQDQFPTDPKMSKDTDGDGIDDSVDTDIDNDGLYNWEERTIGTDPTKYDTDGDGYSDKEDAYPLDPKRWKKEVPVTQTPNNNQAGTASVVTAVATNQTPSADSPTTDATKDMKLAGDLSASTSNLMAPSSTVEILTPTSTQEVTTTEENYLPTTTSQDNTKKTATKETKDGFWNLSTGLWGFAIFCGLIAGLFTWLAKRKSLGQ